MYSPNVPRCQHIKVNGTQCGSPALRKERFCYFHHRWHENHITIAEASSLQVRPSLNVPVLEDANSIQVALMQVIQLLLAGQIDHRTAGLVLYGLQTASGNLQRLRFEPGNKFSIVTDLATVEDICLDSDLWENADFDDVEEEDQEREEEEEDEDEEEPAALPEPVNSRSLSALLRLGKLEGKGT
jgi:hypothetical protein